MKRAAINARIAILGVVLVYGCSAAAVSQPPGSGVAGLESATEGPPLRSVEGAPTALASTDPSSSPAAPTVTAAATLTTAAPTVSDCIALPSGPYGFAATAIADPETLGQHGSETIMGVPCGFTCSFAITWPNGTKQAGMSAHTIVNGNGGHWTWSWKVPTSTWGGKAKDVLGCSAPGHPANPSTGYFTVLGPAAPTPTPPVVTPAPTPSWTMSVTVTNPISAATGALTFHLTLSHQVRLCDFWLGPPGDSVPPIQILYTLPAGTTDVPVTYGPGPTGTWDWRVACDDGLLTREVDGTTQAQ